jgi:hypothetical protein
MLFVSPDGFLPFTKNGELLLMVDDTLTVVCDSYVSYESIST